jgi:hypothetical protein
MSSTTTNSININDIVLMQEIIRACSMRGSFKPEEFTFIGNLNNKLTELIKLAKAESEKTNNESADDQIQETEDVSTT